VIVARILVGAMSGAHRAVVVCVIAAAGCRELPELAPDVCGNGVVEDGEDCDGAIDPALGGAPRCEPVTSALACRYTCSEGTCPIGWACGDDAVCRHGTGVLVADPPIQLAHRELEVGDIDGDGQAEPIGFAEGGVRIAFGDRTILAATPDQLSGDAVADLDGDGRADVVVADAQGLEILRGEADRSVTAVSYAPFVVAVRSAWFLPVRVPDPAEADAVAVVSTDGSPNGSATNMFFVPSGAAQQPLLLAADTPPGAFGPAAVRADLDAPSAEDEIVVAAAGRSELWILKPIVLSPLLAMQPTAVDFPPTMVGDGRVLAADLDGDGDLDLLAGTIDATGFGLATADNDSGVFVIDAGSPAVQRFAELALPHAVADVPSAPQPFPLAVADLDGDGDVDAVSPDAIFLLDAAGVMQPAFRRTTTAPWREALIRDIDRDGRPDVVVAGPASGLDVLRNGAAGFTRVPIETAGAVSQLRAGDFDGDGLGDIAFRERADDRDRIRVLFGDIGPFAPTSSVLGLPAISRFEIGQFRDNRGIRDVLDDIVVVGFDGERAGISFVTGAGDRRLRAPLFLTRDSFADRPLGTIAGHFMSADALPDLAVLATDHDGLRRLWLFPAAPGAAYRSETAITSTELGVLATLDVDRFAAADLDGDGLDEIVAAGIDPEGRGIVAVITPRLDQPPIVQIVDPDVGTPLDLVAGDLDRDGRDELVIAGTTGLVRLRAGAIERIAPGGRAVCLAQLDADAGLEIAVLDDSSLVIYDGSDLRTQAVHAASGTAITIRAGDLDGDRVDDLVIGDGLTVTPLRSVPQVPR
jgi:hypothetical protein